MIHPTLQAHSQACEKLIGKTVKLQKQFEKKLQRTQDQDDIQRVVDLHVTRSLLSAPLIDDLEKQMTIQLNDGLDVRILKELLHQLFYPTLQALKANQKTNLATAVKAKNTFSLDNAQNRRQRKILEEQAAVRQMIASENLTDAQAEKRLGAALRDATQAFNLETQMLKDDPKNPILLKDKA